MSWKKRLLWKVNIDRLEKEINVVIRNEKYSFWNEILFGLNSRVDVVKDRISKLEDLRKLFRMKFREIIRRKIWCIKRRGR